MDKCFRCGETLSLKDKYCHKCGLNREGGKGRIFLSDAKNIPYRDMKLTLLKSLSSSGDLQAETIFRKKLMQILLSDNHKAVLKIFRRNLLQYLPKYYFENIPLRKFLKLIKNLLEIFVSLVIDKSPYESWDAIDYYNIIYNYITFFHKYYHLFDEKLKLRFENLLIENFDNQNFNWILEEPQFKNFRKNLISKYNLVRLKTSKYKKIDDWLKKDSLIEK